jgi:hypothetical protein
MRQQRITVLGEEQMEDLVLKLSMQLPGTQSKSLSVFRWPKNQFRIVTYASASEGMSAHQESRVIHIHSAQLIPRYALPPYGQNLRDGCDFELCFPGASSGDMYRFPGEDRYKFQRALLGYQVVFEDKCDWQVHKSLLKSKLEGSGLVQVFLADALPPASLSQMCNSPASPTLDRRNSVLSMESTLTTASTKTLRSNGAVIAEHPHDPLIVIYTKIDGQPTFLRIPCNYIYPVSRKVAHHNSNRKNHYAEKALRLRLRKQVQKRKLPLHYHRELLEGSYTTPLHSL